MLKPWMSTKQVAAIDSRLKPSHVMLEWGSGGSTLYFAGKVTKLYTIEHEPTWAAQFKERLGPKNEYHLVLPDVPFPVPESRDSSIPLAMYSALSQDYPHLTEHSIRRYWQFRTYVDHVHTLGVERFDAILVDGRARGMCAAQALTYMDQDSYLFIDDFFNRYEEYTDTFWEMFDLAEKVDKMCVVRKRA